MLLAACLRRGGPGRGYAAPTLWTALRLAKARHVVPADTEVETNSRTNADKQKE